MKYLHIISLLGFLFFSACGSEVNTEFETGSGEEISVEEVKAEAEEKIYDFSRESTTLSGSSELEDDSGYGFAYSASNIFDIDYSTAWCPSGEENHELTINFSEPLELGTVGIVGGFARDEKIYFQNNRLKTLEVFYDEESVGDLSFEDEYEMQFFDMPKGEVRVLRLRVKDVYPGSKYDDTCIAEVDFWSEYVEQKDATAAYNYYQQYKADAAIKPVGVKSINFFHLSGMGPMSPACGDEYYALIPSDSSDFESAPGIYIKFNEYAKVGDKVTIKVSEERPSTLDREDEEFYIYELVLKITESEIKKCEDGNLYVMEFMSDVDFGLFGRNEKVQIFYKDKLIGSQGFNLSWAQ